MSEENTQVVADEAPVAEPVETQVEDATVEATEAAPAPTAALSIQDLANIRKLLDVASQRGAFKTEEFQIVGAVYGKLAQFVDAALATQQAQAEAGAAEEVQTEE